MGDGVTVSDTAPLPTQETVTPAGGGAPPGPADAAATATAPAEPAGAAPSTPAQGAGAEPPPGSPLVDVVALDAARTDAPDPTTAPAPASAPEARNLWSELTEAVGEVPDAPNPKLLEGIDRKLVEKMPPEARAMLRQLLAARNQDRKTAQDAEAEARKKLDADRAALEAESEELLKRQGQFAATVGSDAFKKLLASVAPKEGEAEPDAFTREGQAVIARRTAAAAVEAFLKPIADESVAVQRRAAYHDFLSKHPRMADPAFKGDVSRLIQERTAAGNPIALADAHDLVEGRWLLREENARRTADRAARARSMEHVTRDPASSQPDAGAQIPRNIYKDGYRGQFGALAELAYFRDHPNAKKAALQAAAR